MLGTVKLSIGISFVLKTISAFSFWRGEIAS